MPRPKLEVNEVWILEEVMPYEGSEILGVFVDPEVAKKDRKGPWRLFSDGNWSTKPPYRETYEQFYLLTKHTVRTK